MDNKKRLHIVLVAALLMMATYTVLTGMITRVHNLYVLFGAEAGYYASIFLVPALVTGFAAIPGFFVLRHYKVPHYLSLSLFAALQAFCFVFAFTPIIGLYATWAINIAVLVCIAGAYYLTEVIFNNWDTKFRYKVATATGVAASALIIDRLFSLLY
jgi:hypothetical protein